MVSGKQKWMNRTVALASCGTALAIGTSGCATNTSRSSDSAQYSHYVESLYERPADEGAPAVMKRPFTLAVAEIGEAAPSAAVMERLQKASDVCRVVAGLPAESSITCTAAQTQPSTGTALTRLARDQGAAYLLVLGATVDGQERVTPLAVLDLTIVGAYLVPDRALDTTVRSSAALVDVRSDRVVLISSTEFSGARVVTAAASSGEQADLGRETREETLIRLVDRFLTDARKRAAVEPAGS